MKGGGLFTFGQKAKSTIRVKWKKAFTTGNAREAKAQRHDGQKPVVGPIKCSDPDTESSTAHYHQETGTSSPSP